MDENKNGRQWARTFLLIALGVSVVGNVTHTWLADSTISLALRIPNAIIWPVFTWGAIEIVVRVIWQKRGTHVLARTAVLFPAVPAAITSYEHLFNLQGMMGERTMIQWIAPAAIDGLMIGCTLTLLFTRRTVEQIAPVVEKLDEAIEATIRGDETGEPRGIINDPKIETILAERAPDVTSLPAMPVSPAAPRAPRAPRISWDAAKVIDMILDGTPKQEIMNTTGVSPASLGRLQKVTNMIRSDRSAVIDAKAEKVRPEHVDMIRRAITR